MILEFGGGIVDRYLFEYAKQDLLEHTPKDELFNLTMLTVDTHRQNGWVCEDCKEEFPDQLANVYACSSRKVDEFINWIKEQDFYENTTIILIGDHCSMSVDSSNIIGDFDRKAYYTIINPAEGCVATKNRTVSTFDFFPTAVSSLGIKYDEKGLGSGRDLLSKEETLCEKYGIDTFFSLVKDHSTNYDNHFLYGFE